MLALLATAALAASSPLQPAAAPGLTASAEEPALPARLTLSEALRLFRERGLDLLLADAQVESARADALTAAASPNPGLSGSVGRSFNYDASCDGCSATQLSLGVTDNAAIADALFGKRGLRKDAAAHALAAARLGRADAQRTLEFQLKQAYLQSLLAKAQLDFATQVEQAFARTQQLQQRRLALGAISDADLAKVDVAALGAQQARDQAGQALRAAKAQLALLLGVRTALPEFDVDAGALEFAVPPALQDASREQLLQQARERRPDLQALDRHEQRAQASVDLARRQRWPDPALSLTYAQEGTGGAALAPPTLTLGLSIGLPVLYQQQGEIAKAAADARAQALQRRKLEAAIAADVETSLGQVQTARKLVERMRAGLLDRARKARDLVEVQFRKGAASLLELLDAERTYIATHGEYLADLAAYWTGVAALEQATATELRP